MIEPILDANTFSFLPYGWFGWFAFATAVATSSVIFLFLRNNIWVFARPALLFVSVINLLFQWPIVFLSKGIEQTLENPWIFIISLVLFETALLLWVGLTRFFTLESSTKISNSLPKGIIWVPLVLSFALATIYLLVVPLQCTGMWAFITDPLMASLAREISIKLVPVSFATSAFGALANVAVPVLLSVILAKLLHAIKNHSLLTATCLAISMIVLLLLVLLPGIKGLLIPAGIMVVTGLLLWVQKPFMRVTASLLISAVFVLLIVSFDTLKERNTQIVPYQFTQCLKEVGSYEEGMAALAAISKTGGYGLNPNQVTQLISNGSIELTEKENVDSGKNSLISPNETTQPKTQTPGFSRYLAYAKGIFNRGYFAPTQIAVLHFAYVEQLGSPGLAAAPLAIKFIGKSVDMTSLVYQKFLTIESKTNQDSTGTAPTSSVFSWVAYFGIFGWFAAVAFLISLDAFISLIMRRVGSSTVPIFIGLTIVLFYSMITGDFVTALFSHGGFISIFMMIIWYLQAYFSTRFPHKSFSKLEL